MKTTSLQNHAANGPRQIWQDVIVETVAGGLHHAQVTRRRAGAMRGDARIGGRNETAAARG